MSGPFLVILSQVQVEVCTLVFYSRGTMLHPSQLCKKADCLTVRSEKHFVLASRNPNNQLSKMQKIWPKRNYIYRTIDSHRKEVNKEKTAVDEAPQKSMRPSLGEKAQAPLAGRRGSTLQEESGCSGFVFVGC